MSVAEQFLADQMHPTVIIGAYRQAMDDLLEVLKDQISVPVDVDNREEMLKIIRSSVGTKFVHHWLVHVTLLTKNIYRNKVLYFTFASIRVISYQRFSLFMQAVDLKKSTCSFV